MIEGIFSLPAAVKLGLALLSIVALMRLRTPLGAALLLGSGVLALLFAMPASSFAASLWSGLANDETVFLLFMVVSILVFSGALNASGQVDRIVAAFQGMVGQSRMAFVAFPSLIGLLPMPGGAIFSAPMVEAASRSAKISPARATIANYWFRHIWEYWFPLYPGVILAVQLTGASTGKFMLLQAPLTLFSVAAGHVLILRGIRRNGERRRDFSRSIVARFIRELTPILIVVAAVVMLDPLAELAVRRMETDSMLARRLPILLGLVMACAWLIRFRGLRFSALGKLILKRNIAEMAFMAAGVMMFRAVLENSGAVAALQAELETWNVPVVAVVCALPFTAGIVIGLAFGYVAASFPLVIALLAAIPETERLPYYCLAYSFGYVGMMLSPVHLCLILTSEYFKSRLLRVYRYLLPLGLLTGVFAFALFLIYRVIF